MFDTPEEISQRPKDCCSNRNKSVYAARQHDSMTDEERALIGRAGYASIMMRNPLPKSMSLR